MNMIMVCKDYSVRSSQPNPYMPGLGQGHDEKKDMSMLIKSVFNRYNPEAYRRGHALLSHPFRVIYATIKKW
jgi:hypothetical protein